MTPPPLQKRYRCCYCGRVLNAWLAVAKRPDGAMLLPDLGDWHPAEAGPYLRRMETEDIDAVIVEAYGVMEDAPGGVDKN